MGPSVVKLGETGKLRQIGHLHYQLLVLFIYSLKYIETGSHYVFVLALKSLHSVAWFRLLGSQSCVTMLHIHLLYLSPPDS